MNHIFGLLFILLLAGVELGAGAYYGKQIQSGWGSSSSHGLAGDIYAVDKDTFQIINFSFDDTNADAAFLLGTDQQLSAVQSGSNATAQVLPNPLGQNEKLRAYNGETVMMELPSGKKLSDYTYIAVGDRQTKEIYGGAPIPNGFSAPAPQNIGRFAGTAHDVASGDVTVINDRMIEIKAFRYDGQGPDAFFYVGNTNDVKVQSSPYGKIPDENGVSDRKARAYADRGIVLLLPSGLSATDLKWLSMFCISYAHNFGHVEFPPSLNVPPYTEIEIDRQGLNCEALHDDLQVAWLVSNDAITIELAGNIDRASDYMAFGLSGNDDAPIMLNADVVVTDWKEDRAPRAIDYYLTAYAQCAPNGGACPDTRLPNPGSDGVKMTSGQISNGITRISYTRPLVTGDGANDKAYKTDGTKQQVVWAIGPLNTKDEAAKHYVNARSSSAMALDFNRPISDNCLPFKPAAEVPKPDFKPHHIYGRSGSTVFTAEIGQAGSEQGYKAITGLPSWGIAWYINGILIPELHLKRGVAYTFRVGGGTNPDAGAQYHPLYFTDDREGGYAETNNGTIYPGMINNQRENYAIGGYCEWRLGSEGVKKSDDGYVYQCFETFRDDLYLDCLDNSPGYTEFVFTPDASTPATLYYQCYTHKNLGWKINVYDELPSEEIADIPCPVEKAAAVYPVVSVLTLLTLSLLHFS